MLTKKSKRATKPFEGKVKFGKFSGLRKLARAMSRGTLEPHQQDAIHRAMAFAKIHPDFWMHSTAKTQKLGIVI